MTLETTTTKIYHNVLIVADESSVIRSVQEALASCGVRGTVERCAKAARQKVTDWRWELLMLDATRMEQSLELLAVSRANHPERPVVMLGEPATVGQAIAAARAGCHQFVDTPLDRKALLNVLGTLLPNHEVSLSASAEKDNRCLYQIAGASEAFLRTIRLAQKVAPSSVPVLITGESGTGKELISFLVHSQSQRGQGPYIRVNCAALSESLLESELFGHEKGAFTGAINARKGRFERAHGGTLLLDEISETGPRLQAELLRVLEGQDFERVGGSESLRVNVRIIATSNKDLSREVAAGRFRADLYYRIAGVHLVSPPLRDRREDLPALVWHFVNIYAREVRRKIEKLDDGMLDAFAAYGWPGNVRQLRNVVRTALIMGEGPVLSLDENCQLLSDLSQGAPATVPSVNTTLQLQELERRAILEALARSQRNQVKAARLLGITDRTLREKLRRYRQDGQLEPEPVGEATW